MTYLVPLAALLILLPGLACHAYSQTKERAGLENGPGSEASHPMPPAAQLADALGLSLSLVALAGMATYFLGLRFSAAVIILLYAALALLAGWAYSRQLGRERKFSQGAAELPNPASSPDPGTNDQSPILRLRSGQVSNLQFPIPNSQFPIPNSQLTTPQSPISNYRSLITDYLPFLVLAAILAFRFYQARALVLPAWVDSVHHTLLVRLFLETGGVPHTLDPYMPVPLYYHFGFHLNTALFAFFARLAPAQAVLVFGQILNAAVALAVYRLALALWGDWRRGVVAMLLIGFVSQMPAYYLTWGRYTLLTGAILLALAMAAAIEGARAGFNGERGLRLAVLTSGLILTHYFAAIVFALFLVTLVIERLIQDRQFLRGREFRGQAGSVGVGVALALPWIGHVLQQAAPFLGMDVVPLTQSADAAYYDGYLGYLWYLLGPQRNYILLGIALVALVALGWRKGTRPLAVWTLAFGLLSLPWGVHLSPFRPDHGVILVFLPGALFAADLFIIPLDISAARWLRGLAGALILASLGWLTLWGFRETRNIINPVTVLADAADLRALEWITANTSADAVFFINTAGWQGGSYRGVDGGWWILPLTGRQAILPPALYLEGGVAYATAVIETARRASEITTCDEAFWGLVQETGARHAFLKFGVGSLQPAGLAGCAGVTLIYEDAGIYLFSLEP